MNADQERYQPGPAAAVAGNGDADNAAGDDNNNNIDNIEQQPHDNDTGSDTNNGDDDDDDNDEENDSDVDVANDAKADAAVHRLLRALFDWMQNGKLRRSRSIALAGKLGSILLKRKEFPYRQRKKIRALVTDFLRNLERHEQILSILQEQQPEASFSTIDKYIEKFLNDLCSDIGDMLCDQSYDSDEYRGLDSGRDTEHEVITAIRFFPENLSNTGGTWKKEYPIACVQVLWREDLSEPPLSNIKAIFFVHVLAKLAIEYNSFEENLRGGLLIKSEATHEYALSYLVRSNQGGDEDHQRNADNVFLEELIRLYQMDLFKKEDIQRYNLVAECLYGRAGMEYFPERRFRFLVELDPYSLIYNTHDGYLPLHNAARSDYEPMKRFRSVFDAGMRYFPYQNGIVSLFQKDQWGKTPFQYACGDKNKRKQKVIDIVEDTLSRYSVTTPIHTEDALILAVTDDAIHLDCVFFLLKRRPDVLLSLLRQPQQSHGLDEKQL